MPSGRGSVTLEFKIFQKGNQGAGNITDCTVIVTRVAGEASLWSLRFSRKAIRGQAISPTVR
ncbi:hypothetical protein ECP030481612_1119 [Escherichia coli P0304816.12]|nr:hypothetical protein ECP030481612_1119 [Escherichia coli P0304816.12]